jgi:uncharacterized protein
MKILRGSRLLAFPIFALHLGVTHSATPPPLEQLAADCTTQTYASDQLVCTTPELLELDSRLRTALHAQRDDTVADEAKLEPQQDWFKRRSLCAFSVRHAACLRAAYGERISILEALQSIGEPSTIATAFRAACAGAPWADASVRILIRAKGPVVVLNAAGKVLAVPFEATVRNDWSPFLRATLKGAALELVPIEGDPVHCRLISPLKTAE